MRHLGMLLCFLLLATKAAATDARLKSFLKGVSDDSRCGSEFANKKCSELGRVGDCCSKHGFCARNAASCLKRLGCQSECDDSLDVALESAQGTEPVDLEDVTEKIPVVKQITNAVPLCKTNCFKHNDGFAARFSSVGLGANSEPVSIPPSRSLHSQEGHQTTSEGETSRSNEDGLSSEEPHSHHDDSEERHDESDKSHSATDESHHSHHGSHHHRHHHHSHDDSHSGHPNSQDDSHSGDPHLSQDDSHLSHSGDPHLSQDGSHLSHSGSSQSGSSHHSQSGSHHHHSWSRHRTHSGLTGVHPSTSSISGAAVLDSLPGMNPPPVSPVSSSSSVPDAVSAYVASSQATVANYLQQTRVSAMKESKAIINAASKAIAVLKSNPCALGNCNGKNKKRVVVMTPTTPAPPGEFMQPTVQQQMAHAVALYRRISESRR